MTIADLKAVIGGAQLFGTEPVLKRIRCVPLAEFIAGEPPDYSIKRLLPRRGVGSLFGPSTAGKSFVAIDMAMHIATGKPWRGLRVKPGGIIYICAEAQGGFMLRAQAYCKHYEIDPTRVAFEVLPTSVNLLNHGAELDDVYAAIAEAAARIGKVSLIIVDTLARTMEGGDENSGVAMGAYIGNVSRLADAVEAFALIIHHRGKDASRGARGHSSLKAAVDVELEAEDSDDARVLTLTKSRDGEAGAQFGYRLEQVRLGEDRDGEQVTSCVVIPSEVAPPKTRSRELSGVARVALEALRETVSARGQIMPDTSSIPGGVRAVPIKYWLEQFRVLYGSEDDNDCHSDESIKRAFRRGKEGLLKFGMVVISAPYAWLAKQTAG